jgi:hypothetical protein
VLRPTRNHFAKLGDEGICATWSGGLLVRLNRFRCGNRSGAGQRGAGKVVERAAVLGLAEH